VISYTHIYEIGHNSGYMGFTTGLLPLSVDVIIIASSLVLLYAAKAKLSPPPLARFSLWLGIGATMAFNVGYGLPWGVVGALTAAWPAVAFIMTVETVLQLGKRKRLAEAAYVKSATKHEPGTVRTKGKPRAIKPAGLPPIKAIMAELHVGQKIAYEIRDIMTEENCDLEKARLLYEERREHARIRK
jgi:hypothetical protein